VSRYGNAPRVRVFAGPNGSGKSTLVPTVRSMVELKKIPSGTFVNADEIEKTILLHGYIDLHEVFGLQLHDDFAKYVIEHGLYKKAQKLGITYNFHTEKNSVYLEDVNKITAYFAGIVADFVRRHIAKRLNNYCFETVLSDKKKLHFLGELDNLGYIIYLYFVSTIAPEINIDRVKARVAQQGHDVSEDKIISRYYGALQNAMPAMLLSHRAYFFDNSIDASTPLLVAEWNKEKPPYIFQKEASSWFETYIINKLKSLGQTSF
jgi:predicted ABC-type ATPase